MSHRLHPEVKKYLCFFALSVCCLFSSFARAENYDEMSSAPYVMDNSETKSQTCKGKATLEYQEVGGDYEKWVFIKNTSENTIISITCRARFQYQGQWKEEYKTRKLNPGERKQIGTTRYKQQKFYWFIVGCVEI